MFQCAEAFPQNGFSLFIVQAAVRLEKDHFSSIYKGEAQICSNDFPVQVFAAACGIVLAGTLLEVCCDFLELIVQRKGHAQTGDNIVIPFPNCLQGIGKIQSLFCQIIAGVQHIGHLDVLGEPLAGGRRYHIPPLRICFGGAENYLLVLIESWVAAGNEAVVLTKKKSKFEQAIVDSQIKAEIHGVDFSYSDIKRTRKLLLREKIDVIDVNGINSGLLAVLMNLPIRRVTTVHSNADVDRADKPRLVRKAFVALENYCLHRSKKVIVVSKAIEKLLLERGIENNKIYLIPNGVKEIYYAEKSLPILD